MSYTPPCWLNDVDPWTMGLVLEGLSAPVPVPIAEVPTIPLDGVAGAVPLPIGGEVNPVEIRLRFVAPEWLGSSLAAWRALLAVCRGTFPFRTSDDPSLERFVRLRPFAVEYLAPLWEDGQRVELTLIADNPYRYAREPIPVILPDGVARWVSNASAPTGGRWMLVGPAGGIITITIGGVTTTIYGGLGAGDVLIIDSDARAVTGMLGGVAQEQLELRLAPGSDYPWLPPGGAMVTVTGAAAQLLYRPAYLL